MRIVKVSALALALGIALSVAPASATIWPVAPHKHTWVHSGKVHPLVGLIRTIFGHHHKKAW